MRGLRFDVVLADAARQPADEPQMLFAVLARLPEHHSTIVAFRILVMPTVTG
jgi:hypothetical protein